MLDQASISLWDCTPLHHLQSSALPSLFSNHGFAPWPSWPPLTALGHQWLSVNTSCCIIIMNNNKSKSTKKQQQQPIPPRPKLLRQQNHQRYQHHFCHQQRFVMWHSWVTGNQNAWTQTRQLKKNKVINAFPRDRTLMMAWLPPGVGWPSSHKWGRKVRWVRIWFSSDLIISPHFAST